MAEFAANLGARFTELEGEFFRAADEAEKKGGCYTISRERAVYFLVVHAILADAAKALVHFTHRAIEGGSSLNEEDEKRPALKTKRLSLPGSIRMPKNSWPSLSAATADCSRMIRCLRTSTRCGPRVSLTQKRRQATY